MAVKPNSGTRRAPRSGPRGHAQEKGGTLALDDRGRVRVALKLSDAAAKADVTALRKEFSTRKAAESFLRDAGILTPTGKLSRRFGG